MRILGIEIRRCPRDFPPGFHMEDGCRVEGLPRLLVAEGAHIHCGRGVVLRSDWLGYHAGVAFPVTLSADRPGAEIRIGDESRLNACCVHAWSSVTIGRKCLLAAGAQVLDADGHVGELRLARRRQDMRDEPSPIVVGDHCWIGLNALVLKGVRLGEGCIVGAGSVVLAGEYPPFSLVAGVPARVCKTLPPEDVLAEDAPPEA